MKHSSVSVIKLWEWFDLASLVQGATKHKCRTAVRKFVRLFGDVEASSVTVPMVGQWQCWMRDTQRMSPASVRSYFAAMAQIFTWARDAEVIESDAWSKAKQLRTPRREVVIFDPGEVAALIDAASRVQRWDPSAGMRWTSMILLAAHSGLRAGEILNLRWEDLDLDRGLVHVRYRPDLYGEYWTWGTKTASDRVAPMSQDTSETLHRLTEVATWRYPLLKWSTCVRLQRRVGGIPEDVRKLPYRNLHREFREIKKSANTMRRARGLPTIGGGGLHQLRKTAVTSWARRGVSMVDAQVIAGHQSMTTTRQHYIAIDAEASVRRVKTAIDAGPDQ